MANNQFERLRNPLTIAEIEAKETERLKMKNNESKHTPGPWAVWLQKQVYRPDPARLKDGPNICIANTVANARLIAAAPELLEALSRCLSYLADLNGSQWIIGEDAGSKDMRQRAKALQQIAFDKIAKAVQS